MGARQRSELVAWCAGVACALGAVTTAAAAGRVLEAGAFVVVAVLLGAPAALARRRWLDAEAAVQRREAERDQLERLLERLHQGVVTVDRGGTVHFANPAARRLLGAAELGRGDALPEPWPDLPLRRFAATLFRPGASLARERAEPDDERAYAVAGIPAGPDGDTAVIVVTDVAIRERQERAEREFVANAAHELRTPLTTIRGAIDVLQDGAKQHPVERDRFLAHIERESQRLARLTQSLLKLARCQTGEQLLTLATVPLRPLLEDAAADVQPQDGVEVRVECPPDLAALADRDLTAQILLNLVTNAAQHTSSGSIELVARPLNDSTLALEVRDTGCGIAAEQRERIFDRFYRGGVRDGRGFGLGLAIVRQAVRMLGGTIEIDSAPGTGTVARVTLVAASPLRPGDLGRSAPAEAEAAVDGRR